MKTQLISQQISARLDALAALEFSNAYLYRTLAAAMQYLGYFGAQKHFQNEADDEIKHYQDVVDFQNTRGICTMTMPITVPKQDLTTLAGAIEAAYEKEVETENAYRALAQEAQRSGDAAVLQFAMQVLEHQVPSTGQYGDILARLTIAQNNAAAILAIDTELGNLR